MNLNTMKGKAQILTMALLLITICGHAQDNPKNQAGKKEVKKGLVSFETTTADDGAVHYGFKMNGLDVGPHMVLRTNGTTYSTYNREHHLDGPLIEMGKEQGTIELYTYRKNKKNGPAFKMANGKVAWQKQFKNDTEDINGFQVDAPGQYAQIKGDGTSGFTMEKYDKAYAIGYFKWGYRYLPMIHVWDDGHSYYGQYLGGGRNGLGVMFYPDGSKYVGVWNDSYREGLGFVMDKDGNVVEKGYYDGGTLKTAL